MRHIKGGAMVAKYLLLFRAIADYLGEGVEKVALFPIYLFFSFFNMKICIKVVKRYIFPQTMPPVHFGGNFGERDILRPANGKHGRDCYGARIVASSKAARAYRR